ncbi:MAG: 8-amino-7-oxononanoate synthase, partial [Bacteroidota bacterium]
NKLHRNIELLRSCLENSKLSPAFIPSESAIHCCVISGNDQVKIVAKVLQQKGFDVRPILSPTVPQGKERLRICLHSFNSEEDIERLVTELQHFINSDQLDND